MNKYLIFIFLILFTSTSISADLLCIKKNNLVKNNRVKLKNALLVNATACPAGYVQLLSTDTFQGNPGNDGNFSTTLQGGQQIVGYFSCAGTATTAFELAHGSTSFITQLPSTPAVEKVSLNASTTNCPGTAANPSAAAGFLCLYEGISNNIIGWNSSTHEELDGSATTEGFAVICRSSAAGDYFVQGSWAYKAPNG